MKRPPTQELLDQIASAGCVVSLAYGQCGNKGFMWSVDVLRISTGETFRKPYAAESFEDAVSIASIESLARGWG